MKLQGASATIAACFDSLSRGCFSAALILLAFGAFLLTPSADAAEPKVILKAFGASGEAGGQLGASGSNSQGLAVNRSGSGGVEAGSLYVLDAGNRRVQQFSKAGVFVRAWGIDVDKGGGTGFEICTVASECKAGAEAAADLGAAGSVPSNPMGGIAIDQASGSVYVNHPAKRRIDVFSATGSFIGAFGWGVKAGDVEPFSLGVCTTATGCQVGASGAKGGQIGTGNTTPRGIAISPVNGNVVIANASNLRIDEFDPTIEGGVLTGIAFVKAFGWDVVANGSPSDPTSIATFQICTVAEDCKAGLGGAGEGQFSGPAGNANLMEVAIDSTGVSYVLSAQEGFCNATTNICRVQKFSPAGAPLGEVDPARLRKTSLNLRAHAIAVDPATDHLFVALHVASPRYEVLEYDSAGTFVMSYPSKPGEELKSTSTVAGPLAVGAEELLYFSSPLNKQVYILGPLPSAVPSTPSCNEATATAVTCEGSIDVPSIESGAVPTTYRFEYSTDGTTWNPFPKTDKALGNTPGPQSVEETITGLQPKTLYLIRLCATTSRTVCEDSTPILTLGAPPTITQVFTEEVTQSSAEIAAHVNPNGLPTSYYFEWGETPAYGSRVPAAFERGIGGGSNLVIAKEPISDLKPATVYYFRLVARNAEDESAASATFETLNGCGFTSKRCLELVSPADKGPVGGAGEVVAQGNELRFQAHPNSAEIAYQIGYGLPTSTSPSEILHEAVRGTGGWVTSQIAPVLTDSQNGANGNPSLALGFADDLSCGVFVSTQRLTPDAPEGPRLAGKSNLFRRAADGSWTVLSKLEPTVIASGERLYEEYRLISISNDCERIVFRSEYQYGLPGAGSGRVYEWNQGVLSSISEIPGPGGPEPAQVIPGEALSNASEIGSPAIAPNTWRAVSEDGERLYFTAVSKLGGDIGQEAVFLRDGSGVGIDVSQSQTATVNNDDSVYQIASRNGDSVIFMARYGLASNGTSTGASSCAEDGTGCDLYRYTVSDGQLTDLTPHGQGTGASVVGVVAADDDADSVYFAARGQLVSSKGLSESENLAEDQYSVYLWRSGGIEYVGQIDELNATQSVLVNTSPGGLGWSSKLSDTGDRLLFESSSNFLSASSSGLKEAYLYDNGSETVVCVSCRRDGKPSQNGTLDPPLGTAAQNSSIYRPARTFSSDGTRVFFRSKNRLAVGGTEAKWNLYQWENGQIAFLASSPAGSSSELQFAGSSESGDDVYFATLAQMVAADRDGQADLYDARVGGGFPDPPAPPVGCNPLIEDSCQGGAATGPAAALPPASSAFSGTGNVTSAEQPAKKKNKKNKGKKKKGKGKKGKGKPKGGKASKNGRDGK